MRPRTAAGASWTSPRPRPPPGCSRSPAPAADNELVGVLTRSLPVAFTVGRGNLGATRGGVALGHRYAVALA